VTIIIPALNGEKCLREAIESILAQNYQTIEIIIVDAGSTDNSSGVAQSYKFFLLFAHSKLIVVVCAISGNIAYAFYYWR